MTDTVRIWLIGLMGAGKSTVGRLVANRLDVPYIDNDATIAVMAGTTTLALSHAGGGLLHEWEARYVRELATRPGTAVAGIAASSADRPADLDLLTAAGMLVYLACDVPTLVARVSADTARPWLDGDLAGTLRAMYERRDPVLREVAHLVVDGTRPTDHVADEILLAAPTYASATNASATYDQGVSP